MRHTDKPVTRKDLDDAGLGWLLESTFLARLSHDEQDAVLTAARWRDFDRGEVAIRLNTASSGLFLLVSGQMVVLGADQRDRLSVVARTGPGNLLGERSLHTGRPSAFEVRAGSDVRALFLDPTAFANLMANSKRFLNYIEGLIALREEWPVLLEVLARNKFLRLLGMDDIERLVQSGELVRPARGTRFIAKGEVAEEVFLVVRGAAAVYSRPENGRPRRQLAIHHPGELIGHLGVLLEVPRTADVEVHEDNTALLAVSSAAFLELITRNPPVQRQLMQYLASWNHGADIRSIPMRYSRAPTFVCGAERGLGTTTLAYGMAAVLAETMDVLLVDLEGPETAARLGIGLRGAEVSGHKVMEMAVPDGWGMRVIWPARQGQTRSLMSALSGEPAKAERRRLVLVSGRLDGPGAKAVLAEAEAVVYVRRAGDDLCDLQTRRGQVRFQAIKIEPDVALPIATTRKSARIPPDTASSDRFWRHASPAVLANEATPFGRACRRLVRLVRGRSVGVALGGGGALGFAHIGLLRALEAGGIPVDYVCGVSSGSLMGAVYVGGGMEALDRLVRRRRHLFAHVMACMLSTRAVARWVDQHTGGMHLGNTEIPFYPVGLDVTSGREFVLARGSLGDGVRSASCLPGVFNAYQVGYSRLVDGGVINNVPASVAWQAGADFIVASNIIPTNPAGAGGMALGLPGGRVAARLLRRVDDSMRSIYMLMSQTGRDRATLADYVFDLDLKGHTIYDFLKGDAIAEAGWEQAEAALPNIRYAFENDQSIRF